MTLGVVIVGAGGHAKVCIELLRAMNKPVAFCIGAEGSESSCLGVPVLQGDAHLEELRRAGYASAFIAVGSNALRQRLGALAKGLGYELVNAISPTAAVSPTARLGCGIAIMAGAVVNADTCIGDLVIVNTSASIDHDGRIGEAAHVAPHCGLAGNVTLGPRVFLGIGCKLIPGVSIGADVVAGAGSVIISDIPDQSRIAGIPAKNLQKKDKDK
ncbi:acetyltransferase [Variovorax paradoxus]|jgi:UDP-perosamine 4-acetyltransferase|uniref:acetyltransferase n=1 Tax=Variovorax paradoxus TaxID=34073 RepID=UPI003D65872B